MILRYFVVNILFDACCVFISIKMFNVCHFVNVIRMQTLNSSIGSVHHRIIYYNDEIVQYRIHTTHIRYLDPTHANVRLFYEIAQKIKNK